MQVRAFTLRKGYKTTGDVVMIANTVLQCPYAASPPAANDPCIGYTADNVTNNNSLDMAYVDPDGAGPLLNGSAATFTMGANAKVKWAGLYWGGDSSNNSNRAATNNAANRNKVKLKVPGGAYVEYTATQLDQDNSSGNEFQGFVPLLDSDLGINVLPIDPRGAYSIADVQAGQGFDREGGWSILFIVEDPDLPARDLTVFDGYAGVTTATGSNILNVTVTGLLTPPAGTVNTKVGAIAYEGDRGTTGDGLKLNGTRLGNSLNTAGTTDSSSNFFNASISSVDSACTPTGTTRSPNNTNNFGFDADIVCANGILPNNANSATLSFYTNGDFFYPGALTFVTDLYAPKFDVTKTATDVNGGELRPGDQIEYTIDAKNIGLDPAILTALSDSIPTGTTYVAGSLKVDGVALTDPSLDDTAEFIAASGPDPAKVVARIGTAATPLTGGLVAISATSQLKFRVVVDPNTLAGTAISNRASITFAGQSIGAGTILSGGSATISTPVVVKADMSVTKSHTGSATAGQSLVYTLTAKNNGSDIATGPLRVVDTLPAGFTYTAASATNGWSCVAGPAAAQITCTKAQNLASGATSGFNITVDVVASAAAGSVTNTAAVSSASVDPNATNDTATDPTTVVTSADLVITKALVGGSITAGTAAVYRITVANTAGPSDSAAPLSFTDQLPSGITFVGFTNLAWSCSANATQLVTCTRAAGVLAKGATDTVDISVNVASSATGSLDNVANLATRTTPDPNTANDRSNVAATPARIVDLGIRKTHTGSVEAGNTAAYTIEVTNLGPSDALNTVTVVDTLPSGLTFASGGGSGFSCSAPAAGSPVTCDRAAGVAKGATVTFPIVVNVDQAASAGSVTNTARVSTTGATDAAAGNDTATDPTSITRRADLSLTKSLVAPIVAGSDATYSLTVRNLGPSSAIAPITITDTLPAGFTYVSNAAGFTCSGTTTVTCTRSSALAVGASATLSLTVSVPASTTGTAHNSATATSGTPGGPASAVLDATVGVSADLAVTKRAIGSVVPGSAATYELVVTNNGPSNAAGPLVVTDDLPAGMTYDSGLTAGWTCTLSGSRVRCDRPAGLLSGGSTTVQLRVNIAPGATGSLTNTASASSATPDPTNNDTNRTAPLAPNADLQVTKTALDPLVAGRDARWLIAVKNNGPSVAALPVTITDTLPANTTFVAAGSGGSGWTCATGAAPGTVDCTKAAGTVAVGASESFVVITAVSPSASGTITNKATVTARTTADGTAANDEGTAAGSVNSNADLAAGKDHIGSFVAGQNGTYTLRVTNLGPAAATGVKIVDSLPAGMTFVAAGSGGAGWSCTAGPGAGQVTCSRTGTLAPSAADNVSLVVAVAASLPVGSVDNSATVSVDQADPGAGNNTATDPTAIAGVADLRATKTHSATMTAGSTGTFTIAVANDGPSAASPVTVVDDLPIGMTYASVSGAGWSCANGPAASQVSCTRASLASGATSSFDLTVNVAASVVAATLANTATATSPSTDPTPGDAKATDTVAISRTADLGIAKHDVGTFVAGGSGVWAIDVTNYGPSTAMAPITVTDTLPTGTSFVGSSTGGWACTAGSGAATGTVTCTYSGAPIAVNGTASVTITTAIDAATTGSVANRADITSATTGQGTNTHTDSATDSAAITASADLAIDKALVGLLVAGEDATYEIGVTNAGPSVSRGAISVTDNLPSGLTYVSASGSGWACTGATSVVCTQSNDVTVGARSAVVVTVHLDPTLDTGTVTNSATITSTATADPNSANDTSGASTDLGRNADLSLTKHHTGDFTAGANGTYQFHLENHGPSSAIGPTVISDFLPVGYSFVSSTGGGFTCTATGALVTCSRAAGMAVGAFADVDLVVAIDSAARLGGVENAALAMSQTPDLVPSNNRPTDPTTLIGRADLAVTKSHTGTWIAGTDNTATISVTNNGPSVAAGPITVVDTLPSGFSFVSSPSVGWNCSAGASPSEITCVRPGDVAVGDSVSVDLLLHVDAEMSAGTVTNAADATSSTPDPTANVTTDAVAIATSADIALSKGHSGSLTPGTGGAYELTVSNSGPSAAAGPITVIDTLPANVLYTGTTSPGWTCVAVLITQISCTRPAGLSVNASNTLLLNVLVAPGAGSGVLRNSAIAGSATDDPVSANNTGTDDTSVVVAVDLELVKRSVGAFVAGTTGTYEFEIRNLGPSDSAGPITVNDPDLPAGMTVRTATGPGWTCAAGPGGTSLHCDHPAGLARNTSTVVTLLVDIPAGAALGSVGNTATLTGPEIPPTPRNNTSTATADVTAVADLGIVKSHDGLMVAGGNGRWLVSVTNTGPSDTTTGVTVVDNLALGVNFTGTSSPGWDCTGATPGPLDVTCKHSSTLRNAETSTIALDVTLDPDLIGPVANKAVIADPGVSDQGPNSEADLATDEAPLEVKANLRVDKSHSGELIPGTIVTYDINVSNDGPAVAAAPIQVIDTLPLDFTFVSTTTPDWTCTGGSTVVCRNTNPIAPGVSVPLTLRVAIDPSANLRPVNNNNIVDVASATPDDDRTDNRATDPGTLIGSADLTIQKTHTDSFNAGEKASYNFSVANLGPSFAVGPITVVDTVPAGMTYVPATATAGAECNQTAQTLTCDLPAPMPDGSVFDFAVTVAIDPATVPGSVVNTADVSSSTDDPKRENNHAEDPTGVAAAADLVVSKSHIGPFTAGQDGLYTIELENRGPALSRGPIVITDTLPAGMSLGAAGSGNAGWSCAAGAGTTVECTSSADLGVGAHATFPIAVSVAADVSGASLSNDAAVTASGTTDPTPATATDPTAIEQSADLVASKRHTGDLTAGTEGTYTLGVENRGPSVAAQPITLTDLLPVGLTYVSDTGAPDWSCVAGTPDATGQIVTCTSTTDLRVAESREIDLTVLAATTQAAGSLTNTLRVASGTADLSPGNNTATDDATLSRSADLTITKTHTGPLTAGRDSTYDITVSNSAGPSSADGPLVITDTLPLGLTFVGNSAGWSCAALPGNNVRCERATGLGVGESSAVTLDVHTDQGLTATSVLNIATATSATPDPTPNRAEDPRAVETDADLSITKSHAGEFTAGTNGTYSIVVGNIGPSAAAAPMVVTDDLPPGMTYVSDGGAPDWACTAAAPTPVGQTVTCTRSSSLNRGTYSSVDLTVAVADDVVQGTLTNRASVASPTHDGGVEPNSASDLTTVIASADLSLTKTHEEGPTILAGTDLTYTLTATNNGPSFAAGPVTITDSLPIGMTFVSSPSSDWVCTGTIAITCTRTAGVALGASAAVDVVVHVDAATLPGTLTNNASVSTATPDPTPTTASDDANIGTSAHLQIAKSHAASVTAGENVAYTIAISNAGPSDAAGPITVTDTLPAGMAFVPGAAGAGFDCDAVGQTVTCTRATLLAIGGSASITVTAHVDPAVAVSTLTNTATATSGTADPDPITANDPTDIIRRADLVLAKVHSGAFVAGTHAGWTLSLTNKGPSTADGPITIVDTLPIGISFVSDDAPDWDCTPGTAPNTNVVTCVRTAPMALNESATVNLTVAITPEAAAGDLTNTADATSPTPDPTSPHAEDTASITADAHLVTTKSHSAEFIAGSSATWHVTATNQGPSVANGPVTIIDTLPAGTTFASSADASWTCTAGAAPDTNIVTCVRPTGVGVGATASVDITVNIDPSSTGSITNRAVTRSATPDTRGPEAGSDTVGLERVADIATSKTIDTALVAGSEATFSVRLTNNGPSIGRSPLLVFDTLPAAARFVRTTDPAWTCSAAGVTVSCSRPTDLGVGESASVPIVVRIASDTPNGPLTNRASGYSATDDRSTPNNKTSVTATVSRDAKLHLTKTHPTGVDAIAGGSYTWTLSVANDGPSTAEAPITFTDVLPSGVHFASAAGDVQCTGDTTITCVRNTSLADGDSADVQLNVTLDSALGTGPITNNASVTTATVIGGLPVTASDTVNVVRSPNLRIEKSHVANFVAGTNGTWSIAVTNEGPSDAPGPNTVTDTLPAGATFVSASNPAWSCNVAGQVVTCVNVNPLGRNTTTSFDIVAHIDPAFTAADFTNTASVEGSTPDPFIDNNTANDLTVVDKAADLTVAKRHTGNFTAGRPATYSIDVTNAGPSFAAGPVTVVDTLPAGMTFVSSSGTGWLCGAGSGANTATVTCDHADPLALTTSTFTLTVAVNRNIANNSVLTNNVSVSSLTTDPAGPNTGSDDASVKRDADLSIAKSHDTPFEAGRTGVYHLTVANAGPSDAEGPIRIVEELPAGMTFVANTATTVWTCTADPATLSGQRVVCVQAAEIQVDTTSALDLTVAVASDVTATSLTNVASVSAATNDPNGPNRTEDPTPITRNADLALTKSHTGTFVSGSPGTYRLAITNNGPALADGPLRVVDSLPAGMHYVGGSAGWTCGGDPIVTCTHPDPLAVGATRLLDLTVAVDAAVDPGTLVNRAVVTSPTPDPTPATADDPTVIDRRNGLRLSKTHRGTVQRGQPIVWTLVASNNGPSIATGPFTVTDTLPPGVTVMSVVGDGWSCANDPSTVTCTRPGPLANAAAAPAITLTALVAGNFAGSEVANTADLRSDEAGSTAATATDRAAIGAGADLAITKAHLDPVVAGAEITYVVTVVNRGPGSSTGPLTVNDALPVGLIFVSATAPAGWTCAGAATVSCTRTDPMAPGSAEIRIVATISAPADSSIDNSVALDGGGDDPTLADHRATDRATVVAAPASTVASTTTTTVADTVAPTSAPATTEGPCCVVVAVNPPTPTAPPPPTDPTTVATTEATVATSVATNVVTTEAPVATTVPVATIAATTLATTGPGAEPASSTPASIPSDPSTSGPPAPATSTSSASTTTTSAGSTPVSTTTTAGTSRAPRTTPVSSPPTATTVAAPRTGPAATGRGTIAIPVGTSGARAPGTRAPGTTGGAAAVADEGQEIPLTGAESGDQAGWAVGLILAGVVLVLLARRRSRTGS